MSVIQTIRTRYAKLAGAVIALALIIFVVQSALEGSMGKFFKGDSETVVKVNGERVEYPEYNQRLNQYESLYKVFSRGQPLDEDTRIQLRQQVLNELVMEKVVAAQAEKLGLQVSDAEIKSLIYGPDPDPNVKQFPYFVNQQTGQFDPAGVKQFEAEIRKDGGRTPQVVEAGQQWEALKAYIIRGRLIQKYNALVSNAVSVPGFLLARTEDDASKMASFQYVKVPATAIPDAQVAVTDADIKAYMERHKAQFAILEPSRTIDYVAFDVRPNTADTAAALGALQKIQEEFTTTANTEDFVNSNSDTSYAPLMATQKNFLSRYAPEILALPAGGVYGPYFENGAYKLTRVEEIRQQPDSVKAQHILIAPSQTMDDSAAHRMADSLLAAIRGGANFDSLAVKYSADEGSKAQGGSLGYFTYGTMVPEFNDYVFENKAGDMKVVRTQFGYHIIRINDQKAFQPARKLVTVTKILNISDRAEQAAYAKANEFAARATTAAAFDANVGKNGVNKMTADNVKPYDFVMNGMPGAREIIKWAYDAKVGDVSNPIHIGDRYVIAKVASVDEKGLMPITAQNRPMLEAAVKNEKKLDLIANKYKGQSLDAIASATGQQVGVADSVTANTPVIPGVGYEPKVVGYAFYPKLQPGQVSPGIKGRDGVYFIAVQNRATLPKNTDPAAQQQMATMMGMQMRQGISSAFMDQLRRTAEVKYVPKNIN